MPGASFGRCLVRDRVPGMNEGAAVPALCVTLGAQRGRVSSPLGCNQALGTHSWGLAFVFTLQAGDRMPV